MNNTERAPISVHQFMERMKVGRTKLEAAYGALNISDLPIAFTKYGTETLMLPVEVQEQIEHFLHLLATEQTPNFFAQGHMTTTQIVETIGIDKVTFFRHLQVLCPDWKEKYPTIAQGQRRVTLFPPELVNQVARYHQLSDHRQELAIWRSLRTRGKLPAVHIPQMETLLREEHELIENIFQNVDPFAIKKFLQKPQKLTKPIGMTYVRICQSIRRYQTVKIIQESSDILPLTRDDYEMFEHILQDAERAILYMTLLFIHLALRVSSKTMLSDSHKHMLIRINCMYIRQRIISLCEEQLPLRTIKEILISEI